MSGKHDLMPKIGRRGMLNEHTHDELDECSNAERWMLAYDLSGYNQAVLIALKDAVEIDAEHVAFKSCSLCIFADGSAIQWTNGEDDVWPSLRDELLERKEGAADRLIDEYPDAAELIRAAVGEGSVIHRGGKYHPVSKLKWIEMYGGQSVPDSESMTVVPCDPAKCGDSICHGWRVVPTISLRAAVLVNRSGCMIQVCTCHDDSAWSPGRYPNGCSCGCGWFDWPKLGAELRQAALDAHEGRLPTVEDAYSFLICNPECFGFDDWPENMPATPPDGLRHAYTENPEGCLHA